ncbi:MAG: LysR family transcriptional regulator [Clostridia bacterium]|nr:LysR family transcriptional regulator [Clostridia bacterium]
MNPNNKQNYIKKIAEVKSISIAAELLGISQPALSAYLKKTESELGTVLFDRSRQPLELTETGQAYMAYLEKEAALQKELEQNLADIDELNTGRITVGGAGFFNIAYLPGTVAAFAAEYPGVEIEIVDGKVPELVTMAQKGMLDLFITPVADEPDRFVYEELLEEQIYLAVPADWEINEKLAGKAFDGEDREQPVLTEEEFGCLCENTFIVLKSDQDIGRKIEALFDRYQCQPARRIIAEQTMTTLALTQSGVGISLITESSIRNSGLKKKPALYRADEEICSRKMYIAYPRNKYLSRASMEFMRALKESNR